MSTVLMQDEKFLSEQPIMGYITQTRLPNGDDVIYGVFDTKDDAITFGSKLISAIIRPIYAPSLH